MKFTEERIRGTLAFLRLWASSPYIWLRGSSSWCAYLTSTPFHSVPAVTRWGRSLSVGLLNGGFGGLFWVFIGTVICYSSVVASLAEMESM